MRSIVRDDGESLLDVLRHVAAKLRLIFASVFRIFKTLIRIIPFIFTPSILGKLSLHSKFRFLRNREFPHESLIFDEG